MDWFSRKRRERARRALERQLTYQEQKAAALDESDQQNRNIFLRSQTVRKRLDSVKTIRDTDRVLEVGSGAHGLIFGFGSRSSVGIDPLAADYKRLFPKWQQNVQTVSALGEELPFADGSFEIVLSDNVIDHAEKPEKIVEEMIRVMAPGAMLYFTVNVHHPIYHLASIAHGMWNAAGLRLELSAFADHTVHFSEKKMRDLFARLPLKPISQSSTVAETIERQRNSTSKHPDSLLKKAFFKNALFEVIAVKN